MVYTHSFCPQLTHNIVFWPLVNKEDILTVAKMRGIWERMSENLDIQYFEPHITPQSRWLSIYNQEQKKVIGLIHLNVFNAATLTFHPYVATPHRIHGKEMIAAFFDWFLDEIPESIQKLLVFIPDCYPEVHNFAKNVGFNTEGKISLSYTNDNKLHDIHILGLTRKEIEDISQKHHAQDTSDELSI